MSTARSSLKRKNFAFVSLFVVWCLSLYLAFSTGVPESLDAIGNQFSHLNARSGLLLMMMPIVILVLSGFLPAGTKAQLVFWRVHFPLPGHRAYSVVAPRDPRIDMNELVNKCGVLPTGAAEQNTHWYSLYKNVQDAIVVQEVHGKFLLARDLAVFSLTFCVLGTLCLVVVGPSRWSAAFYAFVMFSHYIVLAVTAQNYGRGLVSNALLEYLALEESAISETGNNEHS